MQCAQVQPSAHSQAIEPSSCLAHLAPHASHIPCSIDSSIALLSASTVLISGRLVKIGGRCYNQVMTLLDYDTNLLLAANGLTGHSHWLDTIFIALAKDSIYLVPLVLLYVWFKRTELRLLAMRAFGSGLIAWVGLNSLISAIWYRPRPGLKLLGVNELLFHQPDKSFPSDHAAFGMAIALTFLMAGQKKLGWFFFWWTIILSIARVIVGVHYPLDIIGGYATGAIMAIAINYFKEPVDKYICQPIIMVLKKVRLA